MTSSAPEENEKEDPPTGSFSKQDSEALRHLIRSALPSEVIPSENADEVANRISENLSAELASVRTVLRETHTTFSGPLPPPDTLAGYETVLPGLPERIVRMWEEEQAARLRTIQKNLESEQTGQNTRARLSWAGLIAAFILAAMCMIGGIYLSATGANLAGFAAILGPLAALTAVFITGRFAKR